MKRLITPVRLAAIAIGLALLGVAPSAAQDPVITKAMIDAETAVEVGHYLAASDTLKALTFKPDGSLKDPMAFQLWSQFTPFMTNELNPAFFREAYPDAQSEEKWAARIRKAQPRDAIAEIVRRARRTSIVILNEAHYSPRDRAFALEVARALRPIGYATLAAETFSNEPAKNHALTPIAQLRHDGFARFDTGIYTLDPVYAGFVREAMAIGYRPVAYEQTVAQTTPEGGVPEREEAEARNLVAAIFRDHPHAKVLVYVGHGHVAEKVIPGGPQMMAQRLKRITGIDPLTIDQTGMSDLIPKARDAYAEAASRIGDRPAVFFFGDHPLILGKYQGGVDLEVVHPRRSYRFGRPSWLAALHGQPVAIPQDLLPAKGRRLVQAFAAGAPEDAVPLDQVLVTAGSPAPMLLVPTTKLRFAVQDAN